MIISNNLQQSPINMQVGTIPELFTNRGGKRPVPSQGTMDHQQRWHPPSPNREAGGSPGWLVVTHFLGGEMEEKTWKNLKQPGKTINQHLKNSQNFAKEYSTFARKFTGLETDNNAYFAPNGGLL